MVKKVYVFDLDDTLYKEIEYLKAAYRLIAKELWGATWDGYYTQMLVDYHAGANVFEKVCEQRTDVELEGLLNMYRFGVHELTLVEDVANVLSALKAEGIALGIVSDGRKVTQMNKIKALGLERYFDEDMIVISESFGSEKPCEENYRYFMKKFPDCSDFTYVGDNPQKDFLAPNALGWKTVCLLDDGRNIHKQDFSLPEEYLPKGKIHNIRELVANYL